MNRLKPNKTILLMAGLAYLLIFPEKALAADPPKITWVSSSKDYNIIKTAKTNIRATVRSATGISSAILYINNVPYGEPEMSPSEIEAGAFTLSKTVNLGPGDSSIFLIATNVAGSTTSEKGTIKLTTEVTERRLALVFGNSNYEGKTPLRNPVNDANLMEGTLKELGFENIKTLDAGKDQMTTPMCRLKITDKASCGLF